MAAAETKAHGADADEASRARGRRRRGGKPRRAGGELTNAGGLIRALVASALARALWNLNPSRAAHVPPLYPSRSSVSDNRSPPPPCRAARARTPPSRRRRTHDDGVARARLRVRGIHADPRRGAGRDDPALSVRLVGATAALAVEPGQPRPAVLLRPRGTD